MDEEPKRRIRRRRTYSGTGVSDSSQSYGAVSGDEVDDAIDPDIDSQVRDIAANRGSRLNPNDNHPEEDEVARPVHSNTSYERELRLRLTQRLLMRNMPHHKIAEKLGVTTETIRLYKHEIGQRMREAAANMDLNELIGDGMAFYDEVKSMGLRTATSNEVPTNLKLAAMRTSLAANNDRNRFLQAAGVFDVLRFKPKDNNESNDMQQLVAATKALLAGDDADDVIADEDQEVRLG